MNFVFDIQNPQCDPKQILKAFKRWTVKTYKQNFYISPSMHVTPMLNRLDIPRNCFTRRLLRYWINYYHEYALDNNKLCDIEPLLSAWEQSKLIYSNKFGHIYNNKFGNYPETTLFGFKRWQLPRNNTIWI